MARCLIVGCGCRGSSLGRALAGEGHAVRATTRSAERAGELRDEGFDAVVGDPDRVMTLAPALAHVGVLCILLASAQGAPAALRELHSGRLEMLLLRALDSTVRGIVYEAVGSVEAGLLAEGAERVRRFCETSRIPYALIEADPGDPEAWESAALEAVAGVLGSR